MGKRSQQRGEAHVAKAISGQARYQTGAITRAPGTEGSALVLTGDWVADSAAELEAAIAALGTDTGTLALDGRKIGRLDTFGALLIARLAKAQGEGTAFTSDDPAKSALVAAASRVLAQGVAKEKPEHGVVLRFLDQLGELVINTGIDLAAGMSFFGEVVWESYRALVGRVRFRFFATIHQIEQVGLHAVPIVLLITFLIGAIIAQQGIFHFRRFGADSFVVDMVGVLTLRELGVLIVAIMVAGRTGSAFTAEIGSMKMREEIDALSVMGLSPLAVLIIPRLIALMISLPLLTVLGDMAALAGGATIARLYGSMPFEVFLQRLRDGVSINHFWVGLTKAPFMAMVIGLIACIEGLRVKGSAESLGQQTTTSVVKSIFIVILLDGVFAMFFSLIGI
jgi:phospholipid/cholesterol/gamma-HCH transport system permease protein